MVFLPPSQSDTPPRPGLAIAIGSLVAVACAFVVGLISGLTNTEFAAVAILIGFLVGISMRRGGKGISIAIPAAIVALAGSALSSVIAEIIHIVKAGQVPLSIVLGHLSTVLSEVPHYIHALGFLFWALAAYVGGATAAGRGRRARRPLLARGRMSPGGPYGAAPQQPLGGPPQQPWDTPPGQYGALQGPDPQTWGTPPGQYGAPAGPDPQTWGTPPGQYGAPPGPDPQTWDTPPGQYGAPPGP